MLAAEAISDPPLKLNVWVPVEAPATNWAAVSVPALRLIVPETDPALPNVVTPLRIVAPPFRLSVPNVLPVSPM